jgi:hypothetical protein
MKPSICSLNTRVLVLVWGDYGEQEIIGILDCPEFSVCSVKLLFILFDYMSGQNTHLPYSLP